MIHRWLQSLRQRLGLSAEQASPRHAPRRRPPWPHEATAADAWDCAILDWGDHGLGTASGVPATDADIQAFEARYRVRLPADMRQFFKAARGLGQDSMGNDMMAFWSLSELQPVEEVLGGDKPDPERFDQPGCFVFADFCISAWCYAVQLTADPDQPAPVFRLLVPDPSGPERWPSFRAFMTAYADAPDHVIYGKASQR